VGKGYALLVVFGYSRLLWCRFAPRQDMRTLLTGLEDAFLVFGGVPPELLFDQMKAVITQDLRLQGGAPIHNLEFLRFAQHWSFPPRACRPYRAQSARISCTGACSSTTPTSRSKATGSSAWRMRAGMGPCTSPHASDSSATSARGSSRSPRVSRRRLILRRTSDVRQPLTELTSQTVAVPSRLLERIRSAPANNQPHGVLGHISRCKPHFAGQDVLYRAINAFK
jgi:hypothetical protein